jgi:NitT/TauT family transport system ATP-binding protein
MFSPVMALCPMISIRNAGKTYASARGPVTALAGVDVEVRDGEFLSLLGPSGCGKSTLLRCIAGLDLVTEGSISVRGAEVREPPEGMGMVFQRDVLLDWRSIVDNVLLAAEFRGREGANSRRARARCSSASGSAPSPIAIPGSCRAACASAPRSAARCSASPRSC